KQQRKIIQRQAVEEIREYQGGNDAGKHSPEESATIESPPVPLEDIGGDVPSIQPGHDPLQNAVDIFGIKTDDNAHENDKHSRKVVYIGNPPVGGLGIEVSEINIVDNVGLG